MQGCFDTSLAALGSLPGKEKETLYYVAFFNYSTGLERLLKVLLLLDSWHRNQKFLTNAELKAYGHDIVELHNKVNNMVKEYGAECKSELQADEVDNGILEFLSAFAEKSRYFNLGSLGGAHGLEDPLGVWYDLLRQIYEKDIPARLRLPDADENEILVDHIEGNACRKLTREGATLQTETEGHLDERKMTLALPEMRWRLVKLLVPLKALLIAIEVKIRAEAMGIDKEDAIPFLEEFLDFVCDERDRMAESMVRP